MTTPTSETPSRRCSSARGFTFPSPRRAAKGLRLQRDAPAKIVVTDIFMPGKEGIETIFELQKEFPQTKIIVMSGGARTGGVDYLQVAHELGAVKSLKKPFAPQELIDAVRELALA